MKKRLAVLACLAALLPAGAAYADNAVTRFLSNRLHDFTDIFRARVSLPEKPESVVVKVRATALAQAGLGHFQGRMAGMDRRAMGVVEQERWEAGASLFYHSSSRSEMKQGNRFTDADSQWAERPERRLDRNFNGWDDGRDRPFSLGIEAQLFFLPGLDIGLYPEEALDFVFGFLGFDMFHDDERAPQHHIENSADSTRWPAAQEEQDFEFDDDYEDILAPFEYGAP